MSKQQDFFIRKIYRNPVQKQHPITRTPEWHELLPNWKNMLNYYAAPGLFHIKDRINVTIIFEAVSKYFDVPIAGITGPARYSKNVMARQIAQYILRTKMKMPYKPIGRLFNRDHTSVIHSVKFVKGQINLKHQTDIVTHLINIKNQLKW